MFNYKLNSLFSTQQQHKQANTYPQKLHKKDEENLNSTKISEMIKASQKITYYELDSCFYPYYGQLIQLLITEFKNMLVYIANQ